VVNHEPNKCGSRIGDIYKLHLVFRCSLTGDATILSPTIPDVDPLNPDTRCNGAKWVPIKVINAYICYILNQLYIFGGVVMTRLQKVFLFIISIAFIVVCIYAVIQNKHINQLRSEIGTQIVNKFESTARMCEFVENRIEASDVNVLSKDFFVYVNNIINYDRTLMITYSYFFEDVYEPLLYRLTETESEQEKEQIINAVKLFHLDLQEIRKFADSKCQIVIERDENGNPKTFSGDFVNYADLRDINSSLYKEFSALLDIKRSKNVDRLNAIINKED
jgi:hypothetical protein